ncbi:cytoplasmic polyadenylation element-binding protein 2-like [Antedon mediterranea]|uniref:cytoplasmic polyadenylation element-binding protein 2-like n=1 Tax=Antedon mediterranea TaxID=105859 RepID=UPI003AF40E42
MGDYGYRGTTSHTRPLSPLEFYPINRGTTSLFSSNNNNNDSATIMQDEIIAEKLAMKQQSLQLQQLSPSAEVNSDNSDISPKSKSEELNSATVPEKDFKQEIITESIDSSTASTLQQQLVGFQQEPISTLASSTSANSVANNGVSPAFWSSALADETQLQNLHSLNGTVQFPNYTLNASMFSPSLAASQLNMQKQQQQQHRHSCLPPQPTQQAFFQTASQLQQVQLQQAQIQQLQAQVAGSLFIPQKQYNWSNPQQQQQSRWSTASGQTLHQHHNNPWSAASSSNIHSQNATNALNRRSMPSLMNSQLGPLSPTKGRPSNPIISPPKFQRSSSVPGKNPMNMGIPGSGYHQKRNGDINTNTLFPYHGQDRQMANSMGDPMKLSSLEHQLLDIMKGADQPLDPFGSGPWSSPLFNTDGLLDDGQHDQVVPSLMSPSRMSPRDYGGERFSRKVFVGGLPPDIDEEEITASFRRFGPLVVDWPHKAESKSYFPPKGYAFLLFQDERSVQALIDACIKEGDKLYLCVSSPTIKDKPVQIRPWNLGDSDFVLDGTQPLDPRKTIFVGGVPRPLRALELAMIMDRLYGGVCYAGIDTDPELKYPKGAGRVAFANQQSYIAAISARFVQLQHGDIDKRVEVKPYVLDDQMCDECQGTRCAGKFAPFFCANVTCLQYYCEICWATIHSRPGREFHKPLVKEGSDRPRTMPFRW